MSSSDTVPTRLRDHARERPEEIALEVRGNSFLTYGAWWERACSVALGLVKLGLQPGQRVVLPCDNAETLDYAVAYVGVQICGCVAVPVFKRHGPRHLAQIVARSGAVGIIGQGSSDHVWGYSVLEMTMMAASGKPEIQPQGADTAEILFTSGTTGLPKGVMATHANILFTHEGNSGRSPRIVFHAIPPATNAGQGLMLLALHPAPHRVITIPDFHPRSFFDTITTYRPDHVVLVPAQANRLLRHADATADLSSVSLVRSVSAPISGKALGQLATLFSSAAITSMYTTTEAWPARLSVEYDPDRPEALGKPRGGSAVRIVDENLRDVEPGTQGEVLLSAHGAPRRRYDDDLESTRRVFLGSGWIRTGDIGRVDSDGYLYLVDRISDLVVSGGHNVSTLEVENVAAQFEGVEEAAAFGLPHPVNHQVVALAVVGTVDIRALGDFLDEELGEVKSPQAIFPVPAIPRNALGKPLKGELRDLYAARSREDPGPDVDPGVVSKVRAIWSQAFAVEDVPDGSSFLELGGDSFASGAIRAAIASEFGRDVSRRNLLGAGDVRAFARTVLSAPYTSEEDLKPIPRAVRLEFPDA